MCWKEEREEERKEGRMPSSVINAKIEENSRMGKTIDLFKKIRATKGTFHAKMGTIRDRNGMDQQKQKILKRDGKNAQNCAKKIFMTHVTPVVWSFT